MAESASHTAAPAEPPLIDLDGTVFIQLGLFILAYVVLSRVLFAPYLKMRAARTAGIEGARDEAAQLKQRAQAIVGDYEQRMTAAKKRGSDEQIRLRSAGAQEEQKLIAFQRSESQQQIGKARTKIASEIGAARTQLGAESNALAQLVVKSILHREVSA